MPTLMLQGLLAGVTGGLAALLMLPVCVLLRRARAPGWLICLLWGAVALRFALPGGLIPLPLPQSPDPALAEVAVTVQQLGTTAPAALPTAAAAAQPEAGGLPSLWLLPGLLWLAGTLVLLLRALISYRRLARRVALACRRADGAYGCAEVKTPFTLGFFRPRIYLPDSLDGPAREAVLLHERTHIRRGDPLTKPLYYLVVCLHWWNPLAWLAFRQFELAMEYACDEAAVRGKDPAQRTLYCESLLQFAVRGHIPGCLAFGQFGVKARIRHLLRYRKPAVPVLILSILGAALAATVCMAAPRQTRTESPAPQSAAASAESAAPATEPAAAAVFSPDSLTSPLDFYLYASRLFSASSHKGDDLRAPVGTPVYAAAGGTVLVSEYHYSYGNYIIIDHGKDQWGKDWQTLYAHLDGLYVAAGETVSAHQFIGTVGNTGSSTGPHLHLELSCNGALLAPSDFITYQTSSDLGQLLTSLLEAAPRMAPDQTTDAVFGDAEQDGTAVADGDGVVLYLLDQNLLLYHGCDAQGNRYASLYTGIQDCTVQTGQTVRAGTELGSVSPDGSFACQLFCNGQPANTPAA